MASLEDPNCPVGQTTFLLLSALIAGNCSVVCRVLLPVIGGNVPHTQNTPNMTPDCCSPFNTPNVVNSNLILSSSSFLRFQVNVDTPIMSFNFQNFLCIFSFFLCLWNYVLLEMHLNEVTRCLWEVTSFRVFCMTFSYICWCSEFVVRIWEEQKVAHLVYNTTNKAAFVVSVRKVHLS